MQDSNIQSFDDILQRFGDYKKYLNDAKTSLLKCNLENTKSFSGVYSIVNIGMGCCVYLKYNFDDNSMLGYFLHSDCYGQYGDNTNDYVKAQNFVKKYKLI